MKRFDPIWGLFALTVIIGIGSVAGMLLLDVGNDTERTANEANRVTYSVAQCNGGNLRTAYELANQSDGTARHALAEDVFTINDCMASVQQGRPVPVSLAVQDEYVRLVVEARVWPQITDGAIVGSVPLPSEQRNEGK